VEVLEIPGCPEGSLKTVAYIQEKSPSELIIKTHDEDCVRVLRLVLPLFGYVITDVGREGEIHVVKTRRSK